MAKKDAINVLLKYPKDLDHNTCLAVWRSYKMCKWNLKNSPKYVFIFSSWLCERKTSRLTLGKILPTTTSWLCCGSIIKILSNILDFLQNSLIKGLFYSSAPFIFCFYFSKSVWSVSFAVSRSSYIVFFVIYCVLCMTVILKILVFKPHLKP